MILLGRLRQLVPSEHTALPKATGADSQAAAEQEEGRRFGGCLRLRSYRPLPRRQGAQRAGEEWREVGKSGQGLVDGRRSEPGRGSRPSRSSRSRRVRVLTYVHVGLAIRVPAPLHVIQVAGAEDRSNL